MFDDMVTIIYLLLLCFLNLAWGQQDNEQRLDARSYGAYVGVFVALGLVTMFLPFLWFHFFHKKVNECEAMIREGQALYMSVSIYGIGGRASDDR
jgi:hypothetical protein